LFYYLGKKSLDRKKFSKCVGWPSFSSPYLASLHCSAITAQTTVYITNELYEKILDHPPQILSSSTKISARPWPINGGVSDVEPVPLSAQKLVLLTGHEDGSVRIWDASSAALHQIGKFSTSSCFLSDDMDIPPDDEDAEDDDEWPPFRKVGVFDPYSDDPRLAVKKLCLCPVSGLLTVAGTAGQVVVAEFSDKPTEKDIPVKKKHKKKKTQNSHQN